VARCAAISLTVAAAEAVMLSAMSSTTGTSPLIWVMVPPKSYCFPV
jgi:hypothetical protein